MPDLLRINDVEGHPHQLEWKNSQVPFFCDGCKELGFGLCYQCPNKACNFILHEECGIRRLPPFLPFLNECNFQFHRENPLEGARVCDACALDIQGFLYQCSCRKPHDLHPCCAKLLPAFSLSDIIMEIYLRKEISSKCLKCRRRRRSGGNVQGWAYESSDGKYSYHVACMKEAWLENWKKGYFQRDDDVSIDENKRTLLLQNLSPNNKEVVALRGGGQSSKVMKGVKWLITFLQLVVSAIFGDPVSLIFNLFQISQM